MHLTKPSRVPLQMFLPVTPSFKQCRPLLLLTQINVSYYGLYDLNKLNMVGQRHFQNHITISLKLTKIPHTIYLDANLQTGLRWDGLNTKTAGVAKQPVIWRFPQFLGSAPETNALATDLFKNKKIVTQEARKSAANKYLRICLLTQKFT